MLTIPHCKESLSRAYVTAVVGRSRHNLLWGREFDYGVDGSVRTLEQRGTRIRETGLGFDFQSKSTTQWAMDGTMIVYDLEASAYHDLAARSGSGGFPFLLVLLCLPPQESDWLEVSTDQLILKKCAYWTKPAKPVKPDAESSSHTASCRIRLPISNVFTPEAVARILGEIQSGAMLP